MKDYAALIDAARVELFAARAERGRLYPDAMSERVQAEGGLLPALENVAARMASTRARRALQAAEQREKNAEQEFERLWAEADLAKKSECESWAAALIRSDLADLIEEEKTLRHLGEIRARLFPHSQEIQGRLMSAGLGCRFAPYSGPAFDAYAAADAARDRIAVLKAQLADGSSPVARLAAALA